MFEKRKNSQSRTGISLIFAIAFLIAGIYVGLSLNDEATNDEPLPVAEVQRIPNLSGEWIGTTTQDYADDSRYDYRIVITQDNTVISGMSYLDMIDDYEIYAEERIEGYVQGATIVYSEVETLVLDNATRDQWCLTQTTLTYQNINGQETLIGDWEYTLGEDPDCEGISGRVILTRQPE